MTSFDAAQNIVGFISSALGLLAVFKLAVYVGNLPNARLAQVHQLLADVREVHESAMEGGHLRSYEWMHQLNLLERQVHQHRVRVCCALSLVSQYRLIFSGLPFAIRRTQDALEVLRAEMLSEIEATVSASIVELPTDAITTPGMFTGSPTDTVFSQATNPDGRINVSLPNWSSSINTSKYERVVPYGNAAIGGGSDYKVGLCGEGTLSLRHPQARSGRVEEDALRVTLAVLQDVGAVIWSSEIKDLLAREFAKRGDSLLKVDLSVSLVDPEKNTIAHQHRLVTLPYPSPPEID